MSARVIGIGQPFASDDGVGWAVIDALAEHAVPDVELLRLGDPSALVTNLEGRVIVVDALLAPQAVGSVQVLGEAELSSVASNGLSSHGLGVVQAIALARALGRSAEVTLVAVGIAAPARGQAGLSAAVTAAVPIAAEAVLRLLGARS